MTGFASLCVLSYERPEFLETCLETLANADAPYELIVHDDGSRNEEVLEMLQHHQRKGRISSLILNTPGHNQGQGIALNRMFGMAKGDPIIKLDQDLVFRPGWLARVNEILDSNRDLPGADPSRGLWAVTLPYEPRIGLLGLFHYLHEPVDSRETIVEHHGTWQEHTHICGSAFALRREAWEELGPFEEHSEAFAEDWAMQKAVTDSPSWVCGLPNDDLVQNQGFGIGPSTVVTAPGTVRKIHKEPMLHGR